MKRWALNIAATVSFLLFLAVAGLWMLSQTATGLEFGRWGGPDQSWQRISLAVIDAGCFEFVMS